MLLFAGKLLETFPVEFSGDVNNRKDDFEPDFHFSSHAALKVGTRAFKAPRLHTLPPNLQLNTGSPIYAAARESSRVHEPGGVSPSGPYSGTLIRKHVNYSGAEH